MPHLPIDSLPGKSERVRKLIYRASYTGMKETDLLLGKFAKLFLPDLNDHDLMDFENLLTVDDQLIYSWVSNKAPVPNQFNTKVFRLIKKFNNK